MDDFATEPEWLFSTGTQNEESLNESQASTSRLAREGERSCLVSTTRKNAE